MTPPSLPIGYRASHARLAIAIVLAGLGGCVDAPMRNPAGSSTGAAPYIGVFTGEFVDGKPLYRFPTIEVVGSRSGGA